MQRVVQLARQLIGARLRAEQVRPADVPDEERVSRQNRLRRFRLLPVGHDDRDGLGRVARRLEELQRHLPHADLVAVLDGNVRELRAGLLAEVDLRARPLGELAVAGDEVGVQVRLDHVPDAQALRLRRLDVDVDVTPGIDDGRLAVRADQIGGLRETAEVELFEFHGSAAVGAGLVPAPHNRAAARAAPTSLGSDGH